MKLEKIQLMSLITKAITMVLGIIQSIIIVRILSPAQFGLVGLTMSIGGVIGVSQHMGVVDGAIREIAVLKKKKEIGKVFWVSQLVRQLVTIPLSIILLLLAGVIANKIYGRPEIATYLQVFAAALVLQGLQDVHGATLTGMKRFVSLYFVQIATAVINIAVFGYLTWRYQVNGFFWAIIVTTSVMVVMYSFVISRSLRHNLALPSMADIKKYAFKVMRIGVFMYIARIFFIVWQRLPLLLLGGVLTAEELGFLNISQTFGSKLTIIAMALSEVNLSWMSSLYSRQKDEFIRVVTKNMHRVLILMMLITITLLFFTPEILTYVIGTEYLPAHKLILLMTFAFFLYALNDIGTSSVFVPADSPKLRTYVFGIMTLITGAVITVLLFFKPDALLATWAVLAGAAMSYITMVVIAKIKFHVPILTKQLILFLLIISASVWWLFTEPTLPWRIIIFFLITIFVLWEAIRGDTLPLNMFKKSPKAKSKAGEYKFICFAGAEFDLPTWTNRQHITSRLSQQYPVLYIEPRIWIIRYIWRYLKQPEKIISLLKRIIGTTRHTENGMNLHVKSQWNLIPGSREINIISNFNHLLNKFLVKHAIKKHQFNNDSAVIWIYDTEASEYLPMFPHNTVLYDCVDNHAAQAGVDRNPKRVKQEENNILKRADIVTVTSKQLLKEKKRKNKNTHLVLNAGDVKLFATNPKRVPGRIKNIPRPIIGTVGALDDYKIDFPMLSKTAQANPRWQFVFIGKPVVDQKSDSLEQLQKLDNVHILGQIERQKVPAYVHNFDVCIIPYRANRYNQASFPLKFWEFMATGKPIVVTGLPELADYKRLIGYVDKNKNFARQIQIQLESSNDKAQERKQEAKKHSWDNRLKQILKIIKQNAHRI